MTTDIIILQRGVPHYRLPLFTRLWEEFGWKVVAASNTPAYKQQVHGDHPFVERFEFRFPDPNNPYRCNIPLGKILRETGAKAVISEFSMRMSSTYELVARRRLLGGPRVLFWSHGYNMDRGLGGVRRSLMQWPRTILAALADGHVCYSEEGRDFLSNYMSRGRLFVARNTIDVAPLQSLANSAEPFEAPGRPHLLIVSRLTLNKKIPRLVQIFHKLRAELPEAGLTIVGDGPDAEAIRREAGSELGRSIIMAGKIYDETILARHFASADVTVFPGAAGLSINHSLAYGVPVIAYDRTSAGPGHGPEIAYVVDDVTGMRVPAYNEDAMLRGLLDFFSRHPDPKAEYRDRIRKYVAENLSLDKMVEEFREVNEFLVGMGINSERKANATRR
jgi:glycosyltransferase involved in cell wall biosynthesis